VFRLDPEERKEEEKEVGEAEEEDGGEAEKERGEREMKMRGEVMRSRSDSSDGHETGDELEGGRQAEKEGRGEVESGGGGGGEAVVRRDTIKPTYAATMEEGKGEERKSTDRSSLVDISEGGEGSEGEKRATTSSRGSERESRNVAAKLVAEQDLLAERGPPPTPRTAAMALAQLTGEGQPPPPPSSSSNIFSVNGGKEEKSSWREEGRSGSSGRERQRTAVVEGKREDVEEEEEEEGEGERGGGGGEVSSQYGQTAELYATPVGGSGYVDSSDEESSDVSVEIGDLSDSSFSD